MASQRQGAVQHTVTLHNVALFHLYFAHTSSLFKSTMTVMAAVASSWVASTLRHSNVSIVFRQQRVCGL